MLLLTRTPAPPPAYILAPSSTLTHPLLAPSHPRTLAFSHPQVLPEGLTPRGGWRCFREFHPPPFKVAAIGLMARYGDPLFPSKLWCGAPIVVTGHVAAVAKNSTPADSKPAEKHGHFLAICVGKDMNISKGTRQTRRYVLVILAKKLYVAQFDSVELRPAQDVEESITPELVTTYCHNVFNGRTPVAVHSSLSLLASDNSTHKRNLRPHRDFEWRPNESSPEAKTPKPKPFPKTFEGLGPAGIQKFATPELLLGEPVYPFPPPHHHPPTCSCPSI